MAVTDGTYTTTLAYDPLGRLWRTATNVPGQESREYLYDGDALVAEFVPGTSTMLRRYVHGPAEGVDDPMVWYEGASTAASSARFSTAPKFQGPSCAAPFSRIAALRNARRWRPRAIVFYLQDHCLPRAVTSFSDRLLNFPNTGMPLIML